MDISEQFAANLVRLREVAGLTQRELASRASVHPTEIRLLESGKQLPRADTLVKLTGALDVSMADLLEGISWEPPQRSVRRHDDG